MVQIFVLVVEILSRLDHIRVDLVFLCVVTFVVAEGFVEGFGLSVDVITEFLGEVHHCFRWVKF